MKPNLHKSLIAVLITFISSSVYAAGTSAGRTLLEPTGARPAAMGEAFTAASNDIAAFGYNPASLDTLKSSHASFMYEKGFAEDTYGQFMVGRRNMGLSVGYYNGGSMDLTDASLNTRTVTAKKDMTASIGYAVHLGRLSVGAAGKYISSELAEKYKASAFAGDIGFQLPVTNRIHLGAALQNFGSKLKYVNESNDLPRIARAGLGIALFSESVPTTLLLDAPYMLKDKQLRAGIGLESLVGPLALRAGYRSGNELASLTFGAGFLLGGMSIDYSYGLVDDLDANHRVSLGLRFGGEGSQPQVVTRRPELKWVKIAEKSVEQQVDRSEIVFAKRQIMEERRVSKRRNREVYIVKKGDTLGVIAQRMYGDSNMWRDIYAANRHLMKTDNRLEVGQRIVLP